MQLSKVQLARSIWLFDIQELNPRGLSLSSVLASKFAKRYNFQKLPSAADIASGSATWADGVFTITDQQYGISVQIHNDGIVADTRYSTDVCDLFISDLISWTMNELSIQHKPRIKKRIYRSEVTVYVSRGMAGLCEKLDGIADSVSKILATPHELSAIFFGSTNASVFTFERRLNTPFEENAFFSAAVAQTSQHLELLGLIEKVLEPQELDKDLKHKE